MNRTNKKRQNQKASNLNKCVNAGLFLRKPPLWAAPIVWQVLYSLELTWFGVSSLLGQTFRTSALFWLNEPPFAYLMLALGIFGFLSVFSRYYLLHLIFGICNVFLFSMIFLAYCQTMILAPTVGVYGSNLLGAMWLCIRIFLDNRIKVAIRTFLLLF